jgi:TM2 domain-containing membrane protein YozV
MSNVIEYLPELEGDEQLYVADLVNDLPEDEAQRFARVYRERRKEPQMILLLALVGFVAVAGVHRFVIDEIGMGLLYLFTAGLCFIGTIVDVINYKSIAFRYNRRQADEVLALIQ